MRTLRLLFLAAIVLALCAIAPAQAGCGVSYGYVGSVGYHAPTVVFATFTPAVVVLPAPAPVAVPAAPVLTAPAVPVAPVVAVPTAPVAVVTPVVLIPTVAVTQYFARVFGHVHAPPRFAFHGGRVVVRVR